MSFIDAELDKVRNVVERSFNTVKQWRAMATHYDKLAIVYRGAAVLRAITKQGALKVYAEHAAQDARSSSATDPAQFDTVRPSGPVASPASDVPLDLDQDAETSNRDRDQTNRTRGVQTT